MTDKFRCRCGTYIDPAEHVSIGGEIVCTNATCRATALADALGPKGAADYEKTRQRLLSKASDTPP